MSDQPHAGRASRPTSPGSATQLAETVDQLTHKLDVKTQAKERAAQVADRATTDDGRPRPELVAAALPAVLLVGVLVWWRRR